MENPIDLIKEHPTASILIGGGLAGALLIWFLLHRSSSTATAGAAVGSTTSPTQTLSPSTLPSTGTVPSSYQYPPPTISPSPNIPYPNIEPVAPMILAPPPTAISDLPPAVGGVNLAAEVQQGSGYWEPGGAAAQVPITTGTGTFQHVSGVDSGLIGQMPDLYIQPSPGTFQPAPPVSQLAGGTPIWQMIAGPPSQVTGSLQPAA